jgi:hypothetical protein
MGRTLRVDYSGEELFEFSDADVVIALLFDDARFGSSSGPLSFKELIIFNESFYYGLVPLFGLLPLLLAPGAETLIKFGVTTMLLGFPAYAEGSVATRDLF